MNGSFRYCVLKGKFVRGERRNKHSKHASPHYELYVKPKDGSTTYQCAVNVYSKKGPPELRYKISQLRDARVAANFSKWESFSQGLTFLDSTADSGALDYVRGLGMTESDLSVAEPSSDDPDGVKSIEQKLENLLSNLIHDRQDADVYVFGQHFGRSGSGMEGVHDIHMNQGNSGHFAQDNGVWQDGGVLIHFLDSGSDDDYEPWRGDFSMNDGWHCFLTSFQSQTFDTDDHGNPKPKTAAQGDESEEEGEEEESTHQPRLHSRTIWIVSACFHPGSVTLLNSAPDEIALDGWTLNDETGNSVSLDGKSIAGNAALMVPVSSEFDLSSEKGAVVVLMHRGSVHHQVEYSSHVARAVVLSGRSSVVFG